MQESKKKISHHTYYKFVVKIAEIISYCCYQLGVNRQDYY